MAWGQLPSIALADNEKIIGAPTPVPPSKVFDADLGCPLCWQEVKSKDIWSAVLEATNADFVVDLGAGSGITARTCLTLGIPWVGLCWNKVHAHWLNNVVDRWALEEIVKKKSPLHEQDLAKLVSAHFSDVLQQIQDRDKVTGDGEDPRRTTRRFGRRGSRERASVSHCGRWRRDRAWSTASFIDT